MAQSSIAPHGGTLINRLISADEVSDTLTVAASLPQIPISTRQISDLELIANGAFSPLDGFMGQADYQRVVNEMHLANGLPWSIPVVLAVGEDDVPTIGATVALTDEAGQVRALLEVQEAYPYDKEHEAKEVYRTTDSAHPGVAAVYGQKDILLGGPVTVLPFALAYGERQLAPAQTRAAFEERGWRTIVGFQTRNPVHRAHEYIQKSAMEIVDGLLLHPLVGETKSDDIPADVRMRCYEALLANYYPAERVLLSVLPAAMRYAGPREAIFHALVRKNYGCTHFIVGRDHAGVGTYYGTYDAQVLFDQFTPEELGIVPLKFDNSFFCRACGAMASKKTCPHDESHHVSLSGTAVRTMLRDGQIPPVEFTRPEVAQILIESMR